MPLASRLGANRQALRQALDPLIELGLVMRNPGYGHPSRPEYVLTDRGRGVARSSSALVGQFRRLGVEDIGFRKWTLPVLAALESEQRFGELSAAVNATPRALSLALKDLAAANLVDRRVHDGYPPSSTYLPSTTGRTVQRNVAVLLETLQRAAMCG